MGDNTLGHELHFHTYSESIDDISLICQHLFYTRLPVPCVDANYHESKHPRQKQRHARTAKNGDYNRGLRRKQTPNHLFMSHVLIIPN